MTHGRRFDSPHHDTPPDTTTMDPAWYVATQAIQAFAQERDPAAAVRNALSNLTPDEIADLIGYDKPQDST